MNDPFRLTGSIPSGRPNLASVPTTGAAPPSSLGRFILINDERTCLVRVAPAVAALVSAVTLAAGAAPPAAAQTAPRPVRILKIFYDSPGPDLRTKESLNAEYITLLNTGRRAVNLKGWKVRDKSGSTYTFGKVVLRAKKRVTLRTGPGDDGAAVVYWNRKHYVWNNDEDTAYLLDRTGRQIDSCSYRADSRSASVDC